MQAALQEAFRYDPEGLARVRDHRASDRVTTVMSPTGPVAVVGGSKLHSVRDPQREARRFVRSVDLEGATVVILLGYGNGYVAEALRARTQAEIIAFEPDLDLLAEIGAAGEIPPDTQIVTTASRLGRVLYSRLRGRDRGVVVPWAPSLRLHRDVFAEAAKQTVQSVDRAGLRERTARLRVSGWLDHYLQNLVHVATGPGLPAVRGALGGAPAFIVAAGPSLDRNVAELAAIGNRGVILAVNTAAGALARAGIKPDAIVVIESLDVSAQLRALPWLSEVPAFIELTAHPALWELPFAQRIPISVDTSSCARFSIELDPGFALSAGFCVANAATAIGHAMDCSALVLVGSDLAYAGERIYASGTVFEGMRAKDDGDSARIEGIEAKHAIETLDDRAALGNRTPDRAKTQWVDAWGGQGKVRTTRDFVMFRDWYAHSARAFIDAGAEPINATEGGAAIDGWTELPLSAAIARVCEGRPATAATRFRDRLETHGLGADALRTRVGREMDTIAAVVAAAREAQAAVQFDPDGDLNADEGTQVRLLEIAATVSELLRQAPLAAEATFAPIESLRQRGEGSTLAFYQTIERPLVELGDQLAHLLQTLGGEVRQTG